MLGVVPALGLMAGLGCNGPITFMIPRDSGSTTTEVPSQNGDAGADTTPPGDGGLDAAVDDVGPNLDAPTDRPIDTPMDTPVDMDGPVDMPIDTPRDTPIDTGTDVPRDTPPDTGTDVPRDTPIDAGGPVVCTVGVDSTCRLPGLRCLAVSGTTGRCVECLNNGHCSGTPATPFCDNTNLFRCVECLSGGDCPTPGTTASDHPSTCTSEHHCLNGCDDSSGVACPKAGFTCGGSGAVDHLCFDCMLPADCPAGTPLCIGNVCLQCSSSGDCPGQVCDMVSGRCVQCADSRDCKTPALPLCNPTTHLCGP